MVKNTLPLIIANPLFQPYHHMLATGLDAAIKKGTCYRHGLLTLLVTTTPIFIEGVCLSTEPTIGFQEFGSPVSGFILATAIAIAAGLGAVDNTDRRWEACYEPFSP